MGVSAVAEATSAIPHGNSANLLPHKITVNDGDNSAEFSTNLLSSPGMQEVWIEILAQLAACLITSLQPKNMAPENKGGDTGYLIKVKNFSFSLASCRADQKLLFKIVKTATFAQFTTFSAFATNKDHTSLEQHFAIGELQFIHNSSLPD